MLESVAKMRVEELRRRHDLLERELKAWLGRCSADQRFEGNYSQLRAIQVLVGELLKVQVPQLDRLEIQFSTADAFALADDISISQGVWDFFRDKLEIRFNPDVGDSIRLADMIAWSCYRPVVEQAAKAGILKESDLREPPLTFLGTTLFARTWARGKCPVVDGKYPLGETRKLPIPVIELPGESIANLWELMAIPHEVAHDLEGDLGLAEQLEGALREALQQAQVPQARIDTWIAWRPEISADLIAQQLVGPTYAEYLLHLLLLPEADALSGAEDPDHPTPYLRLLLACAHIETLLSGPGTQLGADAAAVRAAWRALFPNTPANDPFFADFPIVIRALLDAPLPALKGAALRSLLPYSAGDDKRLRNAAQSLMQGILPAERMLPRMCISAARRAVSRAGTMGNLPGWLETLNERTAAAVKKNTPPGLKAAPDVARDRFYASFAAKLRGQRGNAARTT